MVASSYVGGGARAPIWPLFLAPLVAGVYYHALRSAFAVTLPAVVFDASDVDFKDIASLQWGYHWIYRIFAEASSLAFGTFVASGIARERGRQAAIIGGLSISLFYLLRNAGWLYVLFFTAESVESIEPWYQHALEVAIIAGAPFLGAAVSRVSSRLNSNRAGFGGINRLHFLWLWVPAAFYAGGMIAPIVRLWLSSFVVGERDNRISEFMQTIIYGLPVLAYLIPASWGLTTLAHENEAGWSRPVNNIVGAIIIVVGWFVAMTIQFFWQRLIAWLVS